MPARPDHRTDTAPLDRIFDVLGSPARRRILVGLREATPRSTHEFTVREEGPEGDPPGTPRIELHHNHLPRLEAAGFVEWDREGNEVARGPAFDEVEPFLSLIDDHREELPGEWP